MDYIEAKLLEIFLLRQTLSHCIKTWSNNLLICQFPKHLSEIHKHQVCRLNSQPTSDNLLLF